MALPKIILQIKLYKNPSFERYYHMNKISNSFELSQKWKDDVIYNLKVTFRTRGEEIESYFR